MHQILLVSDSLQMTQAGTDNAIEGSEEQYLQELNFEVPPQLEVGVVQGFAYFSSNQASDQHGG